MEVLKPWQFGYNLDYLKSIEKMFDSYNSLLSSPFSKFKKNNISSALRQSELDIVHNWTTEAVGYIYTSLASVKSSINMYSNGVLLATKLPLDRTVYCFAHNKSFYNDALMIEKLREYKENTFLFTIADDIKQQDIVLHSNFKPIGSKFNSFGDIFTVYYRGENRSWPTYNSNQLITISKLNIEVPISTIDNLLKVINSLALNYTNHYSNYNSKNSWSALSLRGFLNDSSHIEKPAVMNKSYFKTNKDISFQIQDTSLKTSFEPYISQILDLLPGDKERVRFMRLSPAGGELTRHTDQTDKDLGINSNQLMRIHIPLVTNDRVIFTSYNVANKPTVVNMKIGNAYYLDIRKPHTAINGGNEDRIHLVIDVFANDQLLSLLT